MDEEKRDELEEKQEEAAEERAEEEHVVEEKKESVVEKPHHEKSPELRHNFNFKPKLNFNKDKVLETVRGNPWIVSTFVMGAVVLVLMFTSGGLTGSITGGTIGANDAGEKLLNYYESTGVEGLVLESVEKENGLYKVNFEYQGSIVPMYMTLDGKLTGSLNPIDIGDSSGVEVPKSDKPIVELFVMTHCPYGTMAEKGFMPAVEALGDTVDAKIRFVHYFMHEPEETETPRQVCIREEQEDKWYDYLKCFLEGDGNADVNGYMASGNNPDVCMEKVLDKAKVDDCMISGKADDYYNEDSKLSNEYGVEGSPTLVVNGVIVNSGREPQSYLQAICSGFNEAPSECELELSTVTPSAGFGYAEGSATDAQC